MKIAVWDTYVRRPLGRLMHFDVLVNAEIRDKQVIEKYIENYLSRKGISGTSETARCEFCHVEEVNEQMQSLIERQGYGIIEFENCS